MELLTWIEARLARWLAYADWCLNAEGEVPRCQSFWTFVSVVLGVACAAVAAVLVTRAINARRESGGRGGYDKDKAS